LAHDGSSNLGPVLLGNGRPRDRLDELGALRPGINRSRALDIMRAIDTFESYVELTLRRDWTPDEYAQWFRDLLAQQLLRG